MAVVRSLSLRGKEVNVPTPNVFGAETGVVQFGKDGLAEVDEAQAKALVAALPSDIEVVEVVEAPAEEDE